VKIASPVPPLELILNVTQQISPCQHTNLFSGQGGAGHVFRFGLTSVFDPTVVDGVILSQECKDVLWARKRHDYACRRGGNSAFANFARDAEPGVGDQLKTVAKWRRRQTVDDLKIGPKEPRLTFLRSPQPAPTLRVNLQDLDFRAGQIHFETDPRNVRTEHPKNNLITSV
jgi:hypothetical protein